MWSRMNILPYESKSTVCEHAHIPYSQACQLLFQAKLSFHRHEQIHELNSHTRSLTAQFYTVLGFSFSAFTAAQACHPAFCTA